MDDFWRTPTWVRGARWGEKIEFREQNWIMKYRFDCSGEALGGGTVRSLRCVQKFAQINFHLRNANANL
jgi:hypothetical protein